MPRRRKEWSPSSESFKKLLSFLDPANRDAAGKRYEFLRQRLITIFERRGCTHPDEVADATFFRVESLLDQGKEVEPKYREGFIVETGKHVLQEYWDKRRVEPAVESDGEPVSPTDDVQETVFNLCLEQLPDRDRDLLCRYLLFGPEEQRIKPRDLRQTLARQEGISLAALSVRICRIRADLMKKCLCCLKCAQNR
jgi:hypothetical protein